MFHVPAPSSAALAADPTAVLNRPLSDLPVHCDVLVVGAGPAGSAAAIVAARAGLDVVLVDQHSFPRDKVCGDGLIPDAHEALRRIGLLDEVLARAKRATHVGITGPRGGRVDVPGRLAVLPRRELDQLLCEGAARAGARMHAPVRFAGVIEDAGRVCGARLESGTATREIAARWVLVASGATPQALIAAGLCDRRTPSGVALRGYVRNHHMAARLTRLDVIWHPRMKRGYGWIFPCGEGIFNIGVGVAHSHAKGPGAGQSMKEVNLRAMLDEFVRMHTDARDLVEGGEWIGPLKGAPLRCSLEGARLSRPGLMVVGEAAGSTYAFTGEGIGKAMETGMLAADAVVACERSAVVTTEAPRAAAPAGARKPIPLDADSRARSDYERAVHALLPRYRLYEKANAVNNHPWLVDLLVWSARRSPGRVRRMSGVLEETHIPSNPLSPRSWLRLLFVHS